jgi:hypothetical protein
MRRERNQINEPKKRFIALIRKKKSPSTRFKMGDKLMIAFLEPDWKRLNNPITIDEIW